MRIRTILLAVLVTALAVLPAALAAPARTFTMGPGAGKQTYNPSGAGVVEFSDGTVPVDECTAGARECDDTLVELKAGGVLTVSTSKADPSLQDVAIDIYESDASGKAGRLRNHGDQSTPATDEKAKAELDPGFYLVRIDFLLGQGAVTVDVEFAPAAPEAAGDAATAPAASSPSSASAATNTMPKATIKLARSVKASKLKAIGGTAADPDGSVARVEVGLLQVGAKKRCKQLTAKGKFANAPSCSAPSVLLSARGTSSWSLKLPKHLKKGRYVAVARAVDDRGGVQDPVTKIAFKIR